MQTGPIYLYTSPQWRSFPFLFFACISTFGILLVLVINVSSTHRWFQQPAYSLMGKPNCDPYMDWLETSKHIHFFFLLHFGLALTDNHLISWTGEKRKSWKMRLLFCVHTFPRFQHDYQFLIKGIVSNFLFLFPMGLCSCHCSTKYYLCAFWFAPRDCLFSL